MMAVKNKWEKGKNGDKKLHGAIRKRAARQYAKAQSSHMPL
jgi:hypothetical protein